MFVFPSPRYRGRCHSPSRAKRGAKLTVSGRTINKLLGYSHSVFAARACTALFAAVCASITISPAVTASTADPQALDWQRWTRTTFAAAAAQDKLIFLDVGIEGCTACRRMAEVTLVDPAVVRRLRRDFVTISVDAEARPDIGDRYSDWAWPALIFMAPDATQVLAIRGNKTPRNFVRILDELIKQHQADGLSADALAPLSAPGERLTTQLDPIREQVRQQIDSRLNETFGSWRRGGIGATSGCRLEHLQFRAHLYENEELARIAQRSAESHLKLLDPVWGGVFQAYFERTDANGKITHGVIPEKRIAGQAQAMGVFAFAYQLTGETRFRNAIGMIDDYLQSWLSSGKGTFYTSQEDEPLNLPVRISARQYWNLRSDHERRQFGIPPIDHGIYTDKNAEVILAYLKAYEATAEPNFLAVANRAARVLIAERLTDDGWILQTGFSARLEDDSRMRPFESPAIPYLSAQAHFGTAILALYGATGDREWLGVAERIAVAMLAELHDEELGGFFAVRAEPGAVLPGRKPLESNALAARFFYDLGVFTKREVFQKVPEATIRATALPQVVAREGKVTAQLGLTLEKMAAAYVEFSIVGDPHDARAVALFDSSRRSYHPRKLVHFEAPGRYPDRGQPALYICNPDYCTVAIEDPQLVAQALSEFHRPAASPYPNFSY